MLFSSRVRARVLPLLLTAVTPISVLCQSPPKESAASRPVSSAGHATTGEPNSSKSSSTAALYFHATQGTSSGDIVRRALASNGELVAARLEVGRARARLRQAGLSPNPTLDFEHTTGLLTGSAGEAETSVGVSLPLELGGKRARRVELARAEIEAAEAEVADRERRLAGEVLAAHAEALAALRELEITENLADVDLRTVKIVQARVNEGDAAPIELNLLRAEVERMRSRRTLVEGRLRATLLRLKALAGISADEPLRLREEIRTPALTRPPASVESAVETALRTRPDLRLARLGEELAQAGLRLARAQGAPEATAFTRYTRSSSTFDDTPAGTLRDRDATLTFGVSVGLPIFNRNQGAKEEAAVAISQAKARREFLEAVVRSEVQSAYVRYAAAQEALVTYEQGVIERSNENIRVMRSAYEIGAFSVTELLAEQRRLIDSQKDFTEALAERYRALADLQTAIGAPLTNDAAPNKE